MANRDSECASCSKTRQDKRLGMDEHYLFIFHSEVKHQCDFAFLALQDMDTSLKQANSERFWYSTQAFLVAVGNVSKLLWPPREQIENRGRKLRATLSVNNDSPLQLRKFRDHFEHFDERIEQWILSSKRHNFIDQSIGSPKSIVGAEEGDFLRFFDTTESVLIFRGDRYYLKPVIIALKALRERVTEITDPRFRLALRRRGEIARTKNASHVPKMDSEKKSERVP